MTPEHTAAQNRLDDAIVQAARDFGELQDGEVITTWALVAHIANASGPDINTYLNLYAGGSMPNHVGVGLFTIAAQRAGDPDQHDPDDDDG